MCKKLVKWVLATSLKSCGLLLVLTACAATAFGRDGTNVPEIDPSSASSALTLLIGGLLMLTGRRSNR
jgi:hypothetical protein